ncbi:PEBP-like protein [Microthyrium microscopicum]|uniref:PEBP-like protein n=1 Tax=Microthyrium microscopicum TaxID=703497 RepID=A0A6A6URR0_9PEZI|nr:PEBP-like protein [Microthyrium microscopicum]
MPSLLRSIAVAAGLICSVVGQTPNDFTPGTLVKLGVIYPKIDINPPGTDVQSLDLVSTVPSLMIPQSTLVSADGKLATNSKFMIFMIDIDVVRDNVATTVLHWFQPDLIPEGNSLVLTGTNTSSVLLKVSPGATYNPTSAVLNDFRKRQLPPLPPPPAANPNNLAPGALGTRAQAVYFGPAPPPGPPHRYVQVLFAQPANFSVPACFQNIVAQPGATPDRTGRVGFDIAQFLRASRVNTRPLAGNFFLAQNPTPGALTANAAVSSLRNNQCARATPAPVAPAKLKYMKLH